MIHKISMAPLVALELPPPQMVETAAAAGYDFVGLRLITSTPEEPVLPLIGQTPLVRETKRRAEDLGIPILDVETIRLRPDTRVVTDYAGLVETGAYLGARHLLVAGNDPDRARLAENLAELAELARAHGMTADLEFMPWTDVPSLRDAADVLRRVDHPNAGLLIDSIHFDRSASDPEDIKGLPASWFHYLQICDGPTERPQTTEELIYHARHDRLLPGQGGINLGAQLANLPADLTISVEVPLKADRLLAPAERARVALAATRRFLEQLPHPLTAEAPAQPSSKETSWT